MRDRLGVILTAELRGRGPGTWGRAVWCRRGVAHGPLRGTQGEGREGDSCCTSPHGRGTVSVCRVSASRHGGIAVVVLQCRQGCGSDRLSGGAMSNRSAERCQALWSAALAAVVSACSAGPAGAPPADPSPAALEVVVEAMPARGQLIVGHRYRALVRCSRAGACEALCRGPETDHAVYIETPRPTDEPRGVLMVFDVTGTSPFHTPPRAGGTHYWFDLFRCEPRSTEPGNEPPPCGSTAAQ